MFEKINKGKSGMWKRVGSKAILLALVVTGVFVMDSCKDEDEEPTPVDEQITAPPQNFTKKVMIEMFNGESFDVKDADNEISSIIKSNPGLVYSASLHFDDHLEIGQHDVVVTHLGGIDAYPRSAVDRVPADEGSSQAGETIYSRGLWNVNSDLRLQESAEVGLAIQSAITGNTASCEVLISNNAEIIADTRLTVYLIENNLNAINQNGVTGSYTHNRVLRQVLSAGLGDPIDLAEVTGTISRSFNSFDISNYNSKNLYLIAFINKVGPNAETHEILNVQQVKLGNTKNWN